MLGTRTDTIVRTTEAVDITHDALHVIFGRPEESGLAVRLWDGTRWGVPLGSKPPFEIVLAHPGSLRKMFSSRTDLALGEAFIYGDFDIEGNIEAAFALADRLLAEGIGFKKIAQASSLLLRLPNDRGDRANSWQHQQHAARMRGRTHSKRRDSQAIRSHYDVSNDFFALWLDKEMVYSCGYFGCESHDIHEAQARKIDYICRKLRLSSGQRLLDLGCGWGGLVRHAAREYGADAVGITLSPQQAESANTRIAQEGLSSKVRVEVLDYRDAHRLGTFDRIVSVGMFEHVGAENLTKYFTHAYNMLESGGVFVNHGIACTHHNAPLPAPGGFIRRYVFPDGELVPIGTTVRAAEEAGFEVRDIESLREHYMMTLRHWVHRLEEQHDEAVALTDEITYRIWCLYMSASAYGFRSGRLNVYQTLLTRPTGATSDLPLTRTDWYA